MKALLLITASLFLWSQPAQSSDGTEMKKARLSLVAKFLASGNELETLDCSHSLASPSPITDYYIDPRLNNSTRVGSFTTVTVDLRGRTFDKPLPFDEPFFIKGAFKKSYKSVELSYHIVGKNNGAHGSWNRRSSKIDTKDGEFTLKVGPLRPHETYCFAFKGTYNSQVYPPFDHGGSMPDLGQLSDYLRKIPLSPLGITSAEVWNSPFPSLSSYEGIRKDAYPGPKTRDVAAIVAKVLDPTEEQALDVLEYGGRPPKGFRIVQAGTYEWGSDPDPKSIGIVSDVLQMVADGRLSWSGWPGQERAEILALADALKEYKPAEVSKYSVTVVQQQINPPLLSKIQSETGILHAYLPGRNQLYLAANLYFVPVKASAPLQIFQGKDAFYKRFYLVGGVTVSDLGGDTSIQNLVGDQFNILFGVGVRGLPGPFWRTICRLFVKDFARHELEAQFLDAVRITTGVLIFRQASSNPFESNKAKVSRFSGAAIDFEIGNVLRGISSLFGG